VVRQQWRSERAGRGWQWEWLARRRGQSDWRQGGTAREAIRQATLLPPGKQPGWLTSAVAEAGRELAPQRVEAPEAPRASGDASWTTPAGSGYRRLSHASNAALGSAVTALLGLVVGGAGAGPLAGLLLLTGGRAGPLCSPLAFARSPESSRRPLGGRGAARA